MSFRYTISTLIVSLFALSTSIACFAEVPVTASGVLRGDLNFNGTVGLDDIEPFIEGLEDPELYHVRYGIPVTFKGDVNNDGRFSLRDISPFVKLLSPVVPAKDLLLFNNQDIRLDSLGQSVISSDGRYLVTPTHSPSVSSEMVAITVYDTFTGNSIPVKPFSALGIKHFVQGSTSISANGRYLAVTAAANYDRGSFTAKIFRYDLNDGSVVEVQGVPDALFPMLSIDGQKMSFRGFDSEGNQHVYIHDFQTHQSRKLIQIDRKRNRINFFIKPDMSGDGRYVLAPYTNDNFMQSTKFGWGLALIDTVSGERRAILSSSESDNPATIGDIEHAVISQNGKYVLYAVQDSGQIYLYDREKASSQSYGANGGSIVRLSISADGNFISVYDGTQVKVIDRSRNVSTAVPGDSVSLSPDGKLIVYREYISANNQNIHVMPNPVLAK